ncbi:hypothetical protein [Psychrobacillus sp. BM2]|uniref:hypothetical protein n=1 Tax=Psychrobacillus sp. BM2 TaxID=3400421 RepID=UPI003B01890A
MANYLFNKYNVTFGPWSGEAQEVYNTWYGGSEIYGYNSEPTWDGNRYNGTGWGVYGMGSSGIWNVSNGFTSASKTVGGPTGYINGPSTEYRMAQYQRTRTATPATLLQTGVVGTINQYPVNGIGNDGFWYVRTGIENAPIITAPNGGESVNELFTILFADSKPKTGIRYQIQLSLNNGSTWKDIVSLTDVGVSSFVYNFINEPSTSTAKVRVRAYDGQNYGAWDESNGVFTIQHNVAPTMPTNLSPTGVIIDRTKTQRLTWRHNDDDAQSKAVIEWRLQGTTTWNTANSIGAEQGYYIDANTFPTGQIEWRVRTYDQQSLVSPYSAIAVFSSAEPTTAPTILLPTSPVNISRPVIKWSGVEQASYQVLIEDALGATVWDTGEIISGNKAITTGIDLLNGGTYKIKLRIKDSSGLFSTFVDTTVVISYTPPPKPDVSIFINQSGIQFAIENPAPTGTQPNLLENEIYKQIDDSWVRIATNIISIYTDYAVASKEVAQYRIRAIGENGTYSESDVVNAVAPKLIGVYLHDVQDPEMTIHHYKFDGGDGREDNRQREHAFRQYAGRPRLAIEYGPFSEYQRNVTIKLLRDEIGRKRLNQFLNDGATLLYRDGRGRKFYTTLPVLPMTDVWYGNEVSLSLTEIDYREEV